MIDDLFQNIINKVLAMPKLSLSKSSEQEFIQRCNRISFDKTLSGEAFLNDLEQYPQTNFGYRERNALQQYLNLMTSIINDINFFITLLNYAGHDKLGSEMDADILTPLVSRLLPKDPLILQQLKRAMEFLSDVNIHYRYFIDITGIVCWMLDTESHVPLGEEELRQEERINKKIDHLLQHLRDNEYYSQSYLMLKISGMCTKRMRECYDAVYDALHTNNIHEFDNNAADMRNYEKIQTERDSMKDMHTAKDHAFFSAYPEVWNNIKKYIVYEEFSNSLNKINSSLFNKLREFIYKYLNFEAELENDLDDVIIAVPENVRKYFYPDKSYTATIVTLSFLWFAANDTKIPLRHFMDALIKKIKSLEDKEDAKQLAESVIHSATPA